MEDYTTPAAGAGAATPLPAELVAELQELRFDRQVANGTYRGRNLVDVLADEIDESHTVWDVLNVRARSGYFDGLRIGDWADVKLLDTYTAACTTQRVRFLLAHIDPYYWCGDSRDSPNGHHFVFVAEKPVIVSATSPGTVNTIYLAWNTRADNNGTEKQQAPYLCSNLKAWEELFADALPECVSKYILNNRMINETRYDPHTKLENPLSWAWADLGKIWSLSEVEVFGQNVWSKPGYATGLDCQFDLFRDAAHRLGGCRFGYWLRSVAADSSSGICYVSSFGVASYTAPGHPWLRPRPCFLLGNPEYIPPAENVYSPSCSSA